MAQRRKEMPEHSTRLWKRSNLTELLGIGRTFVLFYGFQTRKLKCLTDSVRPTEVGGIANLRIAWIARIPICDLRNDSKACRNRLTRQTLSSLCPKNLLNWWNVSYRTMTWWSRLHVETIIRLESSFKTSLYNFVDVRDGRRWSGAWSADFGGRHRAKRQSRFFIFW